MESESSEEEPQPGDDLESALNNFCQDSDDEKMDEVPGDEDFYDELRKFFVRDEKLAAPVSQESADLVAKALELPMQTVKEKDLMERIVRPSNCECLKVPRTNG